MNLELWTRVKQLTTPIRSVPASSLSSTASKRDKDTRLFILSIFFIRSLKGAGSLREDRKPAYSKEFSYVSGGLFVRTGRHSQCAPPACAHRKAPRLSRVRAPIYKFLLSNKRGRWPECYWGLEAFGKEFKSRGFGFVGTTGGTDGK